MWKTLCFLVVFVILSPAYADDPGKRIQDLEKKIEELHKQLKELKQKSTPIAPIMEGPLPKNLQWYRTPSGLLIGLPPGITPQGPGLIKIDKK